MATPFGVMETSSAPASAQASESRVDRDSHFNGLFQTKQNLRIEGIAEGEIQCEGLVTVVEGARVKAKVTASTITIAGELAGEVICRDVFQIMPTGQVEATVSARRLIVQEGGFYNGDFHMITDSAAGIGSAVKSASLAKDRPDTAALATEESATEHLSTDEWWSKLTGETPAGSEEAAEKPGDASDGNNKKKTR